MPTISYSGDCVGKLFICLKEEKGHFGPNIKKKIIEMKNFYKNINIYATKSGIVTSRLINIWAETLFSNKYFNENNNNSEKIEILLLLDSLPAHWNPGFGENIDLSKFEITRLKIPKNTTDKLQPLDKFFNHKIKYFFREITNHVILNEIDLKLYHRNTIIKICSLIWEQLASEAFRPMIKYCFYSTLLDQANSFFSIKDLCFKSKCVNCQIQNCREQFFLNVLFVK